MFKLESFIDLSGARWLIEDWRERHEPHSLKPQVCAEGSGINEDAELSMNRARCARVIVTIYEAHVFNMKKG